MGGSGDGANSYAEFYRCRWCDEWIERQAMRAHAVVHQLRKEPEPEYDGYWQRRPEEGDKWNFYWL